MTRVKSIVEVLVTRGRQCVRVHVSYSLIWLWAKGWGRTYNALHGTAEVDR